MHRFSISIMLLNNKFILTIFSTSLLVRKHKYATLLLTNLQSVKIIDMSAILIKGLQYILVKKHTFLILTGTILTEFQDVTNFLIFRLPKGIKDFLFVHMPVLFHILHNAIPVKDSFQLCLQLKMVNHVNQLN